jgi:hypothetical protein
MLVVPIEPISRKQALRAFEPVCSHEMIVIAFPVHPGRVGNPVRRRGNRDSKEDRVTPAEPKQDPQDKAFGAAASRDQEIADELEKAGVTEDALPDQPARHPRAAGKAEPSPTAEEPNPELWDEDEERTAEAAEIEARSNRDDGKDRPLG